jgi:hypothetical protein
MIYFNSIQFNSKSYLHVDDDDDDDDDSNRVFRFGCSYWGQQNKTKSEIMLLLLTYSYYYYRLI